MANSTCPPHILAQQWPASIGYMLLAANSIDALFDAAALDRLRSGMFSLSVLLPSSRKRCCTFCAGDDYGFSHILASCVALEDARECLLCSLNPVLASQLRVAPAGDWPVVALSPHHACHDLIALAKYAAAIVSILEQINKQ